MPRFQILITYCILACMPAALALADEAKQVFDSLYSQKIKQVTATADRADDIALAKEMLTIAKDSGSTPKLQILLCESAADLAGRHPDGYATAIEALQLLANEHEDQRDASRMKLIDLLTRQYRTGSADVRTAAGDSLIDLLITMGDEKAEKKQYAESAADYRRATTLAVQRKSDQLETIKAKVEFATNRDRAVKQIARLQEKLLQNANDHATAEEIVKLYVVELDDPATAATFLDRTKDDKLKKMVPLAAKPIHDVDAASSLALGEWYSELAGLHPAASKENMLRRATGYLTRFIGAEPSDQLSRTKADVLLKSANAALSSMNTLPTKVEIDEEWISKDATCKVSSELLIRA